MCRGGREKKPVCRGRGKGSNLFRPNWRRYPVPQRGKPKKHFRGERSSKGDSAGSTWTTKPWERRKAGERKKKTGGGAGRTKCRQRGPPRGTKTRDDAGHMQCGRIGDPKKIGDSRRGAKVKFIRVPVGKGGKSGHSVTAAPAGTGLERSTQ